MALFFGWSYWSMPSKEEQAKQAEAKRQAEVANYERKKQAEAQLVAQQALLATENEQNSAAVKQQNQIRNFGLFSNSAEQEEKFYTIENDVFTITISNKGGIIRDVMLKDYKKYDTTAVTLFDPKTMKFALGFFDREGRTITTENLYYQPVWYDMPENGVVSLNRADSVRFGMRLYANDTADSYNQDKYIEFLYTLRKNEYMLGFEMLFHNLQNDVVSRAGSINLEWRQDLLRNEQDIKNERDRTTVYYKVNRDKVDYLSDTKESDSKDLRMKLDWISFKSRFFVSTLISNVHPFEEAVVETKVAEQQTNNDHYLQSMNASIAVPWEAQNDYNIPMKFYFGPNKYHTLKNYDMDLEKLVPLGGWLLSWINKGVIWVFDLMSSWDWNYGIIILALAILIKIILFPIATKTYRSQAVMKVLKPEIEEISKKFPNKEDAMKKQQATMALYKQAGVNPMGGCLPLLLQMPILFAMFRFFPSSIELRQEGFLWANDLSSYDSILNLGFDIPFYGNHVSLFALLMAISTLIYSHISMKSQAGNAQMPGMKFMMYAMPVMMLGIFNRYASALSYYYFLFNILTFAQMYIMRFFTDEEKIRQKIKENKGKPPKKSGWMQRMEEMAKQQQQARKAVPQKKR
jgi:YidC/Oxa1 family membrane protein insertase